VADLARSARALATGERIEFGGSTEVSEVAKVRAAFYEASERLREQDSILRHSEERLRLAMRTGKLGAWDWDIVSDHVVWTESLYEIHGVRPDQFDPTVDGFVSLVDPDDRQMVQESLQRALHQGNLYEAEFRALRPDGRTIWLFTNAIVVREDGKPVRMLGATMDITERKRAEQTVRNLLRISERLNSSLEVESLLDILVIEATRMVDAESGVAGLRTSEGMACRKYFQAGEFVPLEYCWKPGQGLPGWLMQHKIPYLTNDADSDPQIVHELCSRFGVRTALSVPILNTEREVIGFLELHNKRHGSAFTQNDQRTLMAISETAATAIQNALAYREVQSAEESLRETDRRKDEYLAMLGHELRNPLGVISTAVQLLQKNSAANAETRDLREIVEHQVEHMARLMDDLLDVSRISRGQMRLNMKLCDLAGIVRRTVEDYRATVESSGLELVVTLPERPVWVSGDPTRLAQSISNLINNASKFSDPGAVVSVVLDVDRASDSAVLVVRDTGIGMEPEVVARLFEPFSRGSHGMDRRRGGLGLGLALVKGLIELQGGRVSAASAGPGQGAELTIFLPLREPPALESEIVAPKEPQPGGRRVLVVEDNRVAARTMRMFLTQTGHTVEIAHSGPDGIEAALRFQPEVILCDIGLPGCDGYEVARRIRDEVGLEGVYLIAISGYGQESDKQRAYNAGFDAYLVKPVNLSELEKMLARSQGAENFEVSAIH
jgi:PAS domain S-box-containing protein